MYATRRNADENKIYLIDISHNFEKYTFLNNHFGMTHNAKCMNRGLGCAFALCGYDFIHNVVLRTYYYCISFPCRSGI